MKNFEAILFDIDGTLLNTKELVYQAYEYTFQLHNLSAIPRDELGKMIGKPLENIYKHFAPSYDTSSLCEIHRTFQINNLYLSVPFPNTKDTLNKIKEAGIKIAAITSRSQRTSIRTLELASIKDKIDVVISGEDGGKHKPDPESLLRALKQLGVKPEKAAMVGDTDVDILAGKNAKTKTIGVTYGFHGKRIVKSNPDYVIDDIAEIIPIILA